MGIEATTRIAVVALLTCAGCTVPSSDGRATEAEWVGSISTAGDVTTVINESGSVWAGTARLVEEASIGAESGAEEYLFGDVHSIFADERRIYVVDQQVPAVRMYDHDGRFLGNFGAPGQGPGEYTAPSVVTVDDEGRIYVADSRPRRINVYAPDGEPVDTWAVPDYLCCYPMYVVNRGEVQIPVRRVASPRGVASPYDMGFRVYGAEGAIGKEHWVPDLGWQPVWIEVEGRGMGVRFTPARMFRPLPSGGFVVGVNDSYRFEVHHRDGRKLVVERRAATRVPLHPEEWEWWRRLSVAATRTLLPDYDWDGAEMPRLKPAYDTFIPSMTGSIWVAREALSEKIPDCGEDPLTEGMDVLETNPCWHADWFFDVFGEDGRYLGPVEPLRDTPQHAFQRLVFIDGDLVLAATQDEMGTFFVKRFRVERPQ